MFVAADGHRTEFTQLWDTDVKSVDDGVLGKAKLRNHSVSKSINPIKSPVTVRSKSLATQQAPNSTNLGDFIKKA